MGFKSRSPKMRQTVARSLEDLWDEIRQLAGDQFRAPATEKDVLALEEKLQRPLPSDYRRFLRLADGQPEYPGKSKGHFESYSRLFRAEEVWDWHCVFCEEAAEYAADAQVRADMDLEVEAGIQPSFFCHGWIPIAIDASLKGFLCLDMEPTPEGSAGQVILIDVTFPSIELTAASFGVLLENYLATLKSG